MVVSVDVYRPAAREQLKVVAREVGQPIYEGVAGENAAARPGTFGAPRRRRTAAATSCWWTRPAACTSTTT